MCDYFFYFKIKKRLFTYLHEKVSISMKIHYVRNVCTYLTLSVLAAIDSVFAPSAGQDRAVCSWSELFSTH